MSRCGAQYFAELGGRVPPHEQHLHILNGLLGAQPPNDELAHEHTVAGGEFGELDGESIGANDPNGERRPGF